MPERIAVNLRLPRGEEGFWSIIRALDEQGPWTVPMVEGESNRRQSQVSAYVRKLVKARIATVCAREGGRARAKRYRLLEQPAAAPRLKPDGTPIGLSRQQCLWNAMRALDAFSVRELAYAASQPRQKVKEPAAARYVELLAKAGYLVLVKPRANLRGRNFWRLKPSMDSGPLSPTILRAAAIYDRNRRQVVLTASEAAA